MAKVEMKKQDYELRAKFLYHQIAEADKKLQKDRKKLQSSFQHKKKLIDTLKEVENKIKMYE